MIGKIQLSLNPDGYDPRNPKPDPTLDPPCVASSDTSRDAAKSMKGHTPRLRGEVLKLFNHPNIVGSEGWTCDEIEIQTGLSHQTCSPRVHELAKIGAIVDSGERRKTRTGRRATVWKLTNANE